MWPMRSGLRTNNGSTTVRGAEAVGRVVAKSFFDLETGGFGAIVVLLPAADVFAGALVALRSISLGAGALLFIGALVLLAGAFVLVEELWAGVLLADVFAIGLSVAFAGLMGTLLAGALTFEGVAGRGAIGFSFFLSVTVGS